MCALTWSSGNPVAAKAANCASISAVSWLTGGGQEKHRRPGERHVLVEATRGVDETANLLRRQDRGAVDQHEVQPDPESRQPLGPRDGVGRSRRADHQAGGSQDAVTVRDLDRLVDRDVVAEVVGRDDKALQAATFRRRRKSKNSTSSRRRRFIMSQSRSISQTIEPILEGLK